MSHVSDMNVWSYWLWEQLTNSSAPNWTLKLTKPLAHDWPLKQKNRTIKQQYLAMSLTDQLNCVTFSTEAGQAWWAQRVAYATRAYKGGFLYKEDNSLCEFKEDGAMCQ